YAVPAIHTGLPIASRPGYSCRASVSLTMAVRESRESVVVNPRPARIATPRVAKNVGVMAPRSAFSALDAAASAATGCVGADATYGTVVDAAAPATPGNRFSASTSRPMGTPPGSSTRTPTSGRVGNPMLAAV